MPIKFYVDKFLKVLNPSGNSSVWKPKRLNNLNLARVWHENKRKNFDFGEKSTSTVFTTIYKNQSPCSIRALDLQIKVSTIALERYTPTTGNVNSFLMG